MPDATYKISAVHGNREWSSQHGPMVDYTIELDGLEGQHTLTQKPDTAAPTVGQDLFGHAEPGGKWPSGDPRPPKFKKGQGSGFRQNAQGGRSDKDWEATGRAQGRAHAQEMAIHTLSLALDAKVVPGFADKRDLMEALTKLADFFYDDAQAAKQEGYRS